MQNGLLSPGYHEAWDLYYGGKEIGHIFTRQGIQPQPGFGGFKAIQGQTVLPSLVHTGGAPATASTFGTERAGSTTTVQLAPLFLPMWMDVTGISIMNGASPTGNLKLALFDSRGYLVPGSLTAATAQSGGDAYQRIPFSAGVLKLAGPAIYFVASISSSTSPINCHSFGDFPAGEVAGVYASFGSTTQLTVTLPTTFTAARGPVAALY